MIDKGYDITLIKYAVFFGSVQIFNYLRKNDVKLNQNLMPFAVHGENEEIIHILTDDMIELNNECLYELIKCHHNSIANYTIDNYYQNDDNIWNRFFDISIKYYNFLLIQNQLINNNSFFKICNYDYGSLLIILLKSNNIDVNKSEKLKGIQNNKINKI